MASLTFKKNNNLSCYWLTQFRLAIAIVIFPVFAQCSFAQTNETSATESSATGPESFNQLLQQIPQGSLADRANTLTKLAALNDSRSIEIITALQQGKLTANAEYKLGIRQENESLIDALTHTAISEELAADYKRIPINNSLRNQLSTLLAGLNLNHSDINIRLGAVKRLMSDGIEEETAKLLDNQVAVEKNEQVLSAIKVALAVFNLQSNEEKVRIDAIKNLRGSLEQEARTALTQIVATDTSENVRTEADYALKSIENKISYYRFGENVFFGLSLGSVLLLSAIGLAITFGVMGIINMAHGELMMIGAYTTWVVQQLFPHQLAYSLLIAVPAAFIVAGIVGIIIERCVIRFLYGRPLETLLATFGVSLILQQAARSIFTPLNRAVSLPEWMSGSLVFNPILSITYNRLFILIFSIAVFFMLLAILKKTSLGLKVRAVSQNRTMARAVGVRANWIDALTFGLGSGIAGVAGVALSQLTNVGPNLGQAYIIDSFMVVVFGGVGNLWGTLVGAMGLGILNKFLEPYAGAVLAKVLVLVLLILFIQKKPKGLFPQKGRAAAD
ncbi:MAG: urea ABC transporter permease subunit UrtB [Pseudomonadota bacterium]